MTEGQEETRKEKFVRLLAKNKTRLARDRLIKEYQQELGYPLVVAQFLDLDVSHSIKGAVYQKLRTLPSQNIRDAQPLYTLLHHLEKQTTDLSDVRVLFYYLDTLETGGISIHFREFWPLLRCIANQPCTDIIVVEEHLTFGICVELEEHANLLTRWGFGEENGT